MTASTSFWGYIINAGFVVKCVMLILFFASIASWTVIVERWKFYKKQWRQTKQFQQRFWSGIALTDLYQEVIREDSEDIGLSKIFTAGFQAFSKLQAAGNHNSDNIMDSTQRAMQVAEGDMIDQSEQPSSLLATVGSVSPFIGLFG